MADFPSTVTKLNDQEIQSDAPLTEALMAKMAGNANAFADSGRYLKEAYFSANGSFTLPLNAQPFAMLEGCGGGGGGGSTGGQGGSSGQCFSRVVALTPGQAYAITIGAGGTGGNSSTHGNGGGTSSFSSLATWGGGAGGRTNVANAGLAGTSGYRDGRGAGGGGVNTGTGQAGTAGFVSIFYWASTP